MKWKKFLQRSALFALVGLIVLILFAYPYFAMQRTSGGRVLVVEGWMHHEGLMEARALFLSGNYDHIYVTGTMRPFAYYLEQGEEISLHFAEPIRNKIAVGAGGLPTTKWSLIAGMDTLITERATKNTSDHVVDLAGRILKDLRFVTVSAQQAAAGIPIAFIGMLDADGKPAHTVADIRIVDPQGHERPGMTTHADAGRMALIEAGIPADKVTAVPTLFHSGGRTYASGRTFVNYAKAHGIGSYDVATLGVHARRTWKGFVKANGGSEGIGIIALYDPWCKRWTWWLNPYGWFQMVKEVVALPKVLINGTGGRADEH